MLTPMRDKNESMYREGEGKTPVTTQLVRKVVAGETYYELTSRARE